MAENLFQLFIKGLFIVIGVPTLTYVLLSASIQNAFETAITNYEIFIGIGLFICLLFYIYFGIIKFINELRDFFKR